MHYKYRCPRPEVPGSWLKQRQLLGAGLGLLCPHTQNSCSTWTLGVENRDSLHVVNTVAFSRSTGFCRVRPVFH